MGYQDFFDYYLRTNTNNIPVLSGDYSGTGQIKGIFAGIIAIVSLVFFVILLENLISIRKGEHVDKDSLDVVGGLTILGCGIAFGTALLFPLGVHPFTAPHTVTSYTYQYEGIQKTVKGKSVYAFENMHTHKEEIFHFKDKDEDGLQDLVLVPKHKYVFKTKIGINKENEHFLYDTEIYGVKVIDKGITK